MHDGSLDPPTAPNAFIVGVISDTHGLLRPEALTALASAQHILHVGDVGNIEIGNIEILDVLRTIASVTAIRGNVDTHGPCAELPATEMVAIGGRTFYLVHSLADLDLSPTAAGVDVVVSGHSHRPSIDSRNGVLYLNPGSAGPRRFDLPVTVALIEISRNALSARIVPIL